MQITMIRGVARARVPEPAQGFRIKTASGDVVDLGTEFSVNVDQDGADVHVIDGEVELHPQGSDLLRLDAGASRRLAGADGVVDARPNPRPRSDHRSSKIASVRNKESGFPNGKIGRTSFSHTHTSSRTIDFIPMASKRVGLKTKREAILRWPPTEPSLRHGELPTAGIEVKPQSILVPSEVAFASRSLGSTVV